MQLKHQKKSREYDATGRWVGDTSAHIKLRQTLSLRYHGGSGGTSVRFHGMSHGNEGRVKDYRGGIST